MSMRSLATAGLAVLLAVVGWGGDLAAQEPEAAAEEIIFSCGDCHEQAATFLHNPHVRGKLAADRTVPNAVCESCHGDGTAHMEAGGDPELILKLQGVPGSNLCLGCHRFDGDQQSRIAGIHANSSAVNCLTCHSVHSSEPAAPHLLAAQQLDLCSSCHKTQAAGFRHKPFAHRIGRGGMECSSCHDPHARVGGDRLAQNRSGEVVCLSCHADKRGPFVFPHGAKEVGGCLACHELHGSTNPKQLKRANLFQLCIECHSPITGDTLGSQPPSFHNLNLARYRNCTTCHVAVHGSNRSPQLLK